MQWGDVATWVASAAAVIAVFFAIRADRKSSRSADASASDARRAADAAERAADAASRQVALAEAEASRYVPPWRLEWAKGDTYQLTNAGDEPTFGVEVTAPNLSLARQFEEPVRIDAHSGVTFLTAVMMSTRDRTVVVTWHRREDLSDEPHRWTHPLPFRP